MSDQRATIKSFALANKTPTEAFKFLKSAYGDQCLSRTQVFAWFKEFRLGRTETKRLSGSFPKPTLRTSENIDLIKNLLQEDRRKTVSELSSESGLSTFTVHKILRDNLGYSKLSARWIPRILSDEHKVQRLIFARDFVRQEFRLGKAFTERIVTMDETWVRYYVPEMKSQSSEWLPRGSRPPLKAKTVNSEKKLMLIVFFDARGLIYQHWVPRGQTINSSYYVEVIRRFLRHLGIKRPDYKTCDWFFHQDNARPHVSRETMDFFKKRKVPLLGHPPYSPDLAPCDFHLFPELKKKLAGTHFLSDFELQQVCQGYLIQMSKNGYFSIFENWLKRCKLCIEREGDYVEK